MRSSLESVTVPCTRLTGGFIGVLKKEYLWQHEFASYQDAEKILADAFADYNQERVHSAIGYMAHVEFASQWGMKNK